MYKRLDTEIYSWVRKLAHRRFRCSVCNTEQKRSGCFYVGAIKKPKIMYSCVCCRASVIEDDVVGLPDVSRFELMEIEA